MNTRRFLTMKFNLLSDPWIPTDAGFVCPRTLRASAATRIDSGRPDLDGALLHFLIAVEQSGAGLPVVAFPSDVFMQDDNNGAEFPISALLIDQVGSGTIWARADENFALSVPMALAALLCLQINAPAGGAGHRTGLRGGGPLTTVFLGETLADTVEQNQVEMPPVTDWLRVLPWTTACRISGKGGVEIPPDNEHPLLAYWGTPRRIKLGQVEQGECALTEVVWPVIRTFGMKPQCANYTGWTHPLSPTNSRGSALLTPEGGVNYSYYAGIVYPADKITPAQVVNERSGIALLAFGYDMANMSARGYCEKRFPLYEVGPGLDKLVRSARQTEDALNYCTRRALYSDGDSRQGQRMLALRDEFFSVTEEDFHLVAQQGGALLAGWQEYLKRSALELFDRHANTAMLGNQDARRIASARMFLTNLLEKKYHEIVG